MEHNGSDQNKTKENLEEKQEITATSIENDLEYLQIKALQKEIKHPRNLAENYFIPYESLSLEDK